MRNLHLRHTVYEFVQRLRRGASSRGLILMYHRISTVTPDPWELCVAPATFAAQLQVLRREFQVLPLSQFVQAQQANALPPRAVAITFDDGYADNLYAAQPLLEEAGLPATFFIATGYLEQDREFWWDELGNTILESATLPTDLAIKINGEVVVWGQSQAAPDTPETRLALYQALWRRLYPLAHAAREQTLAELADWVGMARTARDSHRSMTPAELCQFAQSPLVEIGGHTVTHPALAAHPLDVQQKEIQENKRQLETILQRPVRSFSYPHGDATAGTVQLLRKAGFEYACTVEAQPAWRGCHPLQLPRYAVANWSGDEFFQRLQGWLQ